MGHGLKERDRMKFPLNTVDAVIALVIDQLDARDEPNLALLSIVLGAVEQSLTINVVKDLPPVRHGTVRGTAQGRSIPPLTLATVEALYEQFATMIKGSIDMTTARHGKYTTPDSLKKVSDVVWEACPRTVYKDRSHLQHLYTLLAGVDCFSISYHFSFERQCKLALYSAHSFLFKLYCFIIFFTNK